LQPSAVLDLRSVVLEAEVELLELESEAVLGWIGLDAVGGY
jgi:hypothetical protein